MESLLTDFINEKITQEAMVVGRGSYPFLANTLLLFSLRVSESIMVEGLLCSFLFLNCKYFYIYTLVAYPFIEVTILILSIDLRTPKTETFGTARPLAYPLSWFQKGIQHVSAMPAGTCEMSCLSKGNELVKHVI